MKFCHKTQSYLFRFFLDLLYLYLYLYVINDCYPDIKTSLSTLKKNNPTYMSNRPGKPRLTVILGQQNFEIYYKKTKSHIINCTK